MDRCFLVNRNWAPPPFFSLSNGMNIPQREKNTGLQWKTTYLRWGHTTISLLLLPFQMQAKQEEVDLQNKVIFRFFFFSCPNPVL